jgi:hypothetical protein
VADGQGWFLDKGRSTIELAQAIDQRSISPNTISSEPIIAETGPARDVIAGPFTGTARTRGL